MKMRFKYNGWLAVGLGFLMTLSSCLGDLDLKPIDENIIQPGDFESHPEYYIQFMAKLYAGLAVSGQEGPAGRPDIEGFDEGMAQYLRSYWNLQELPSDEALLGWPDAGVPELNTLAWSSANGFVYVMYSRIFFQISLCNDFLRSTTDAFLNANNVPQNIRELMPGFRAEARFLRALSYWHAIDMFGSVSFVTENDPIMSTPRQHPRAEIFQFLVDELNQVEELLPLVPEYGRAGRGALWTLQAKLYLNAEVYTSVPMYDECRIVCEKIIGQYGSSAEHGLADQYRYLFCADNDRYARGGSRGEILMTVPYDTERTRTYGGTMYLTVGSYGGQINPKNYGVNDGWAGPRSTSTLVESFGPTDERAAFFSEGAILNNTELANYQHGYAVVKFNNLLSTDWENTTGRASSYPDTDYPLFRLADVYLMYAECAARGSGSMSLALTYMNYLRERAGATLYASVSDITLPEILAERMRELYWEGHRRTDLVRFGAFTSSDYIWPWKGGTVTGRGVDDRYRLYPIPAKEIAANPGTQQNTGY